MVVVVAAQDSARTHLQPVPLSNCQAPASRMGDSKFDELLTQLGTGTWNILYFACCSYWFLLIPCQVFSVVYLAPPLNYTCRPPQLENVTISEDSCTYWVNTSTSEGMIEEPCTEWDFDSTIYSSTLTSEFRLVCDRAILRATYQSINTLATIFSSMICGYVADRYGRKALVSVAQTLYCITCIGIFLLTNFEVILAFRFILGALATPTLHTLALEVSETSKRSMVGIVLGLPWAMGTMAWGAFAYFIRDWRWLQATVSIPLLLIFPMIYLLDESPRWLIVRGQHDRALKVLKRAARLNKATLPPNEDLQLMMKDIQKEAEAAAGEQNQWAKNHRLRGKGRWRCTTPDLFSTPKMRFVTAMLSINLFLASLVYSGLILSGNSYSSDPFLYIIISGLMEIPAYTVAAPIINRWGRKTPSILGYLVTGASVLCLAFVPSDISWLVMTLAMLGKLAITASFMILFVYEAELLPTEVRLRGVALTIVAEYVGATISPYITDYLRPLVPWLPSVLFGLSSIVAALLLLPLPETMGVALPDTVSDLENLWNEKKKKKKKKKTVGVNDDSEVERLSD
ncbi:organic cation transporter protein-like isoform X2 [Panulirus ornatus]|uniref:organic cation transporter protein-like isoform X2 n=1 Tax=Panulirus ornatus TaxID=150431 RepID=UPI003A842C7E